MNGEIFIKPIVREYNFTVNGLLMTIKIMPDNELNAHPLDILEKDLEFCLNIVKQAPRNQNAVEKKLTLNDILPPKETGQK